MKRTICLLLALCCVISFYVCSSSPTALADNYPRQEPEKTVSTDNTDSDQISISNITFRGIPFGTSYGGTIAELKEQGLEFSEDNIEFFMYSRKYLLSSDNTVAVAGHDMSVQLSFVYLYEWDYEAPKIEDCVLYSATYTCKQMVGDEIIAKLKALYGPVEIRSVDRNDIIDQGYYRERRATWKDEDVEVSFIDEVFYDFHNRPLKESFPVLVNYSWTSDVTKSVNKQGVEYIKQKEQEEKDRKESLEEDRKNQLIAEADGL